MSRFLTVGAPSKGWPTFPPEPEVWYAGTTYVSGPMRGREGCNFDAFDRAEEALLKLDYKVFSPASHDRAEGYDFSTARKCDDADLAAAGFPLDGAILWDLEAIIRKVTDLHLLPEWQLSSGARLEVEAAKFARRTIWVPTPQYVVTGEPEWEPAQEVPCR